MDGTPTCHGHTLVAPFAPNAAGIGDVEVVNTLIGIVAGSHEIGVHVPIGTFAITESAPRDGDEVGVRVDVEVGIHTILECTMVHPEVSGAGCREQVVAAYIHGTGAFKPDVVHDDIVASPQTEDARVAIVFLGVVQIVNQQLADVVFGFLPDSVSIAECIAVA